MVKKVFQSDQVAPPGGAYSQALRAGDFIFVAGTGPVDSSGDVAATTIEAQTALTLENLKLILENAEASLAHVVKTTVHLSDLALFEKFNDVYAQFFSDPKPVRTTVGSQLLDILVEIDVVAYVGN